MSSEAKTPVARTGYDLILFALKTFFLSKAYLDKVHVFWLLIIQELEKLLDVCVYALKVRIELTRRRNLRLMRGFFIEVSDLPSRSLIMIFVPC